MKKIESRILVFAILTLLVVSSASAYVLLSPRRTWDGAVNIIVDQRGLSSVTDVDRGATATVAAITATAAWNGAGSGTRVTAQKGSVGSWQLGDGVVMLNFTDPQRACKGSCLAATFTGFYNQRADGTYRIYDADVVTNTRYAWTSAAETDGCASEFYVEGVMVHEVGHVIGIGHSNVSGATMYPSVSSCNNSPATIEADDRAATNDLY